MITVTVHFYGGLRQRCDGVGLEAVQLRDDATLGELFAEVRRRYPGLDGIQRHVRLAVDEEFADDTAVLRQGAQVALIPPIAGGALDTDAQLSTEPLSVDEVLREVQGEGQGGAVVFIGTVRDTDQGRAVRCLQYEAYEAMALRVLRRIIAECEQVAPGVRVAVRHRYGELRIGEAAVVVAAAAPHRAEAFAAARHCIERLKEDVPIWKREIFVDGAEWVGLGP